MKAKKSSKPKINADIFLIVAEMLLARKEGFFSMDIDGVRHEVSEYCCDNFRTLNGEFYGVSQSYLNCDEEFALFGEFYKPSDYRFCGWWQTEENFPYIQHDYESRIYACLFLYELYK